MIRRSPLRPDEEFRSPLVTRLIKKILLSGKAAVAQRIVYRALAEVASDKKESLEILKRAVENVSPKMEVRPRRVGGATYQIPLPVRHDRCESLAIRWLLLGAKERKGQPFFKRLAAEIKEATAGTGFAFRKKETMHKMAEANRAFAHFRW